MSATVYSQVLICTAESTGASMERTKMPNLRSGSKVGFEPGLTLLRVRHSTAELPPSKDLLQNSCQLIEKSMSSNLVYFVSRTDLGDVLFPFSQLSFCSSHISIGIRLGLFPYISNSITTLTLCCLYMSSCICLCIIL